MKTNDLDDLLSNVADEIDDEYKNDDLLSSVQSVDDIHSIYSFGTCALHVFCIFFRIQSALNPENKYVKCDVLCHGQGGNWDREQVAKC